MWLEAATALLNTKGGQGLGAGIGGALAAPPAGPSNATAGAYGSGMDASGFNVNFSGIQSASSAQDKSDGSGILAGMSLGGVPWWVWAAGAGLVVWRLRKSRQ